MMNSLENKGLMLATKFKDGYYFGKIFRYRKAPQDAIYFSHKISIDDIRYINENNINKVILDFTYTDEIDLSCLSQIEKLEFLDIYGTISASLLASMSSLKLLKVNSYTPIDLMKYPNLEWISTSTPNKLVGIDSLKSIKSVSISGGKELCSQRILDEIGMIPTIDTLMIERSEMRDLSFIKGITTLQVLILKENGRLSSLEGLKRNLKSLRCIKIIRTPKLESLSALRDISSLEYLYIDTCKAIPSISFLNELKNLKTAIFAQTEILDGNLTPLLNLEYGVAIPIKKKYFIIQNGVQTNVKLDQYSFREIEHGDHEIDLWRRIDTW